MADAHPPETIDSSLPGRPAWVAPVFTVLALVVVAVGATQLFGHGGKDATSFSDANAMIGGALPYVCAMGIAWAIPRGYGWQTRLPLALITALFVFFVVRLWPSAALPAEGEAAPIEAPTLLAWLIGLPIAG